jgi:pimeloyl-ACP methyl ester carboxylesterase
MVGPAPTQAPILMLLHEGLGSVGLWRDLPERLAAVTGAGVVVYSRQGYGASTPAELPRPLTYMQDEALQILPKVLDAIGFQRGLLIGHSDGASIATLYAGRTQDRRILGLSLIAPHFFVEDLSITSIRDAKAAYEAGDLRRKLERWHKDVDGAFRGWNDAWLDPEFRDWDISEVLGHIRVPIQIIQGSDDQFGTLRQIRVVEEECRCPVEVKILPAVGHSPHREAPAVTLSAIADFAKHILASAH